MILTDDNFATIVGAVSYGRTLYDNLLKYLRFQMSTLVAYIAIFIGAGIFGIADGVAAEPAADPVAEHGRRHPARDRARLRPARPRPDGAPAAPGRGPGALARQLDPAVRPGRGDDRSARWSPTRSATHQDGAVVAATMLLTTLSLFHVVAALLCRDQAEHDLRPGRHPGRACSCAATASRCWRSSLITALDFLAAHLRHHRRSASTSGASASASPPRSSSSRS